MWPAAVTRCRFIQRWMALPSRRAGYTVAMVERAMRLYDARGRDAALEYYNSPESGDKEWYVFIFDENEKLIALAVNPTMLGEDMRGDVGGISPATGTAKR